MRLARQVSRALHSAGYRDARAIDARDSAGARLIAPNLRVCGLAILVRSASYKLDRMQHRDSEALSDKRAYLQRGARDISGLIAHIKRCAPASAMPHWNSELSTG